jgi:hypothetical protein
MSVDTLENYLRENSAIRWDSGHYRPSANPVTPEEEIDTVV